MNKGTYNLAVLIALVLTALTVWLVDVDRLGSRVFGAKWHLRDLDEGFRQHRGVYEAWKSIHTLCRGKFEKAFRIFPVAPLLFGLLIFEVLYRLYLLTLSSGPDPWLARLRAFLGAVIFTSLFLQLLIPMGVKLL